ncbi:hypothetical protein SDC9_206085 [bioreactor metagenome]|uniref:Uncharacterized protein n=1 Tax=bioreactor metagenome TaxID=1076179 RepID=A0A645J5G5_9ZZZZ
MSLGAVVVAGIAVYPQVELSAVLNDSFIEGRENEVVFIIHIGYGHHQQSLVLGCVTA